MFNKIIIFLAVAIIFYFSIIIFSDITKIDFSALDFKLEYYPLIILILISHTLLSNLRFYRLLHKLKIQISFISSLKIFMAGNSLGLTPGGFGTAIKSYILKNEFNKPITSTLPVIFIERVTELIGILFVLVTLNFFIFGYESFIVSIVGISFVIIFFLVVSKPILFSIFKSVFKKISYLEKFVKSVEESRDSFNQLTDKKVILESSCYSILAKFLNLIAIYFIFLSFGIDLGVISSGIIYYTSLLIGVLSFVPAGIIITETSMLAILLQHKVEFSIAILIMITLRIVLTWILTIAGTITYIIFYGNMKRNK